jgi:hypothetical protein
MQRIYPSPWTPEQYIQGEAHRQIIAESICPICHSATSLQGHGYYWRYLISLVGEVLRIWVARFLCPLCRRTVSYLPDFVLTYRAIQTKTFAAFLDGERQRPDVRSFTDLLRGYQLQLEAFGPELMATVGMGLGRSPPRSPRGLWSWLKRAGDGLHLVTRRLVTEFRVGLFRRYQCHQPK